MTLSLLSETQPGNLPFSDSPQTPYSENAEESCVCGEKILMATSRVRAGQTAQSLFRSCSRKRTRPSAHTEDTKLPEVFLFPMRTYTHFRKRFFRPHKK